jgi:hypothetical protein
MKIKLSIILFIIVDVAITIVSCSSNDKTLPDSPITVDPTPLLGDKLFKACKVDTNDVKYRFGGYISTDTIYLSGLNQGYSWFAYYKKVSDNEFSKIQEWKDVEKLPIEIHLYRGYGKYDTLYLASLTFPGRAIYSEQFINLQQISFVTLNLGYTKERGNVSIQSLVDVNANIILNNGKTKLRRYEYLGLDRKKFIKWYGNTILLENSEKYYQNNSSYKTYNVYSENGDSLITLYQDYYYSVSSYQCRLDIPDNNWISINQKINVLINNFLKSNEIIFERNDYSKHEGMDGQHLWKSNIINLDFEIPNDAKISYEIKKNDNLWNYLFQVIFQNGTKKDVSVRLDIDTGEAQKL